MKLIYARGACSLSVHILLEELGLDYEGIEVSLSDKTFLNQYNPKGYVPAVVLDDGQVLTEAISILQYLEEINQDSTYLPAAGTLERARCLEWLEFISTEIHIGFAPLFFREKLTPQFLDIINTKLSNRFQYMDKHLAIRDFLMDRLTVADMYAIAILRIADHLKIDLGQYPNVLRYKKMMEGIPSVIRAIDLEENSLGVSHGQVSADSSLKDQSAVNSQLQ